MNAITRSPLVKKFIALIPIITGWQIPNDEDYVTGLNSQLSSKIIDEWTAVNFDELEYAVRTYGPKIKDWGKLLNLSLIDECVSLYMDERLRLSALEERLRVDEDRHTVDSETGERRLKIEALPTPVVDWSPEWERIVEQAKNGQIQDAIIIVPIYDWLKRQKIVDKYIPGPDRWAIVEDCRTQFIEEMEHALATLSEKPHVALEKIRRLKAESWQQDEEMKSLVFNLGKIETVRQIALAIAAE